MRNRGSHQNLEGWLRRKTTPAPPMPNASPASATPTTPTTSASQTTVPIPRSLLARADQVLE
jgi:hypothetical protein